MTPGVDIYEIIKERRTIKQYETREVSHDVIARMLDAAIWAPNHHLTEPWRFLVLTGAAKDGLAGIRRQQVAERFADPTTQQARAALDEAYRRMAGASALIAVICKDGATAELTDENRFATAAAIQNILLLAGAEGLASFWSSGVVHYAPARAYLGLADDEFLMGIVQLGYPAQVRSGRRTPASDKTTWFDQPPAQAPVPVGAGVAQERSA